MNYLSRHYLFIIALFFGICISVTPVRSQSVDSSNYYTLFQNQKGVQVIEKGMALEQALKQLETYFDVALLYRDDALKGKRINETFLLPNNIDKALKEVLKGQGLVFEQFNDRTYGIYMRETLQLREKVTKQRATVSGTVTNAQTGDPMIGVNILVVGTSTGTVTGSNGHYSLTVSSLQDTLRFSFIGFKTKTVPIDGQTTIDIAMKLTVLSGQQMVVIGYGKKERENLTTAVTQISGKTLSNRVLGNVTKGLKGQIPGLVFNSTPQGGRPGASPTIQIRGVGSLTGNGGSPYVLVDGVPSNLNTVNPQVVKSVTVLKGPAASAIYGSRAAFGVILITTKKGQPGTMDVSYNLKASFNKIAVFPEKANSLQWAKYLNLANANSGRPPFISDEVLQKIKQYMKDPGSIPGTVQAPGTDLWSAFGGTGDLGFNTNANTNVRDTYYRNWAMTRSHNLSVSGGSKKVNYYLGGGLYNQQGLMRYGHDRFKRYNLTLNTNVQANDWVEIKINGKFNNRHLNEPHIYRSGIARNPFYNLLRFPPMTPIYDPNGNLFAVPYLAAKEGGRHIKNNNELIGILSAILNPLKGWQISFSYGSRLRINSASDAKTEVDRFDVNNQPYAVSGTTPTSYSSRKVESTYHNLNIFTSYKLTSGSHFFKGMVGFEKESFHSSSINGQRKNLITDKVPSISTAVGQVLLGAGKGHWATKGFFTRLQYNYKHKYLLEFDARADGSSRFAPSKRWGFFPSVSIGYNIANENFWKGIRDKVGLLKLRASYGSLGNQDVANYLYLSTLGIHTHAPWIINGTRPVSVTPAGLISPTLTWETIATLDIGLDLKMFSNRFSLKFDWFKRDTKNMFGPSRSFPGVLGISPPKRNNASLKTLGFGLKLRWQDHVGSVQYHIGVNLSNHQSTVTKYLNKKGLINNFYKGKKLGTIWGYTTQGLYKSDQAAKNEPVDQSFFYPVWNGGDVNYKDINGDGKINDGNRTLSNQGDLSIIGNSTPHYTYGINLGLSWQGMYLSMLWTGVGKRDLWFNEGNNVFWGLGSSPSYRNGMILTTQLNHWSPDHKDGYFPRPYILANQNFKNRKPQTRYLQNGAYLRLKNAQIGYTLPGQWTSKFHVKKLQIYVSGTNLLLFSSIIQPFDPEAINGIKQTGAIYPLQTSIALGLNVKL